MCNSKANTTASDSCWSCVCFMEYCWVHKHCCSKYRLSKVCFQNTITLDQKAGPIHCVLQQFYEAQSPNAKGTCQAWASSTLELYTWTISTWTATNVCKMKPPTLPVVFVPLLIAHQGSSAKGQDKTIFYAHFEVGAEPVGAVSR